MQINEEIYMKRGTNPIYQVEPDIKDTIGTTRSASYFYLHQERDSEGLFRT
jgi:hypothetical protein